MPVDQTSNKESVGRDADDLVVGRRTLVGVAINDVHRSALSAGTTADAVADLDGRRGDLHGQQVPR